MKLSEYLEPMKNLPERFSNLAFWRGVRKLKSDIVATFNYIESWGNNVEHDIHSLQNIKIFTYHSPMLDNDDPNFLQKLSLSFDSANHTCSLSLDGFTISKKANQIVIPLAINFNVITGNSSIGDEISLPIVWSPISTSSPTSVEFSYIKTTVVPCYSNYQSPFRGKNYYVSGYILQYPE